MPDRYELQLERAAERSLHRIPTNDYVRIEAAIDQLAKDPYPRGSRKLQSSAPMFRIRIGVYRVLYAVFEEEHIVKIVLVAKRDDQTYRNLNR